MKLEGLFKREDLRGLLRAVSQERDRISVPIRQHAQYLDSGWTVLKLGKHKAQLERERSLDKQLELLVWKILFDMGFPFISGEEGVILRQDEEIHNQVDVVAHDDESVVVVECKASASNRRLDVPSEIAKLIQKRNGIREGLNKSTDRDCKLKVGAILALRNVSITEHDLKLATGEKILVLDYEAIEYFARLARLIGSASRFQLLGELFQGQEIEGLRLKLPAVEAKMGEHTVYTFAITPEDLLKITYVAHRARNNIGSYQRMVQPRRLTRIREYIDDGGVFPTNIVVNFGRAPGKPSLLRFEPGARPQEAGDGSRLGHLTLPAKYQTAWIIDGQHRVLSYSGHKWASSSTLTVTAFDGVDASTQAELFVRINSEQKKVAASHLEALFATLNWHSSDPKLQVRAVISQAIQDLRGSSGSIFADRILLPDEERTEKRCITLKSFADALKRPGLFIKSESNGIVRQFGILWYGEPENTLTRVKTVLEGFFFAIASEASQQWELGDGDGGLVATNRGVIAAVRILAELLDYIRRSDPNASDLDSDSLGKQVEPFGVHVGEFFASLSSAEIAALRQHYGAGAPAELAFQIADYLNSRDEQFTYGDLDKWRHERETTHAGETKRVVDEVERRVKDHVVAALKATYGDGWWKQLPKKVRVEAVKRREEEGEDHPPETYLMIIDYREIATANWTLFEPTLGIPKNGNKEARTKWVVRWNEIRNRSFHGSGARLKPEDFREISEIDSELKANGV